MTCYVLLRILKGVITPLFAFVRITPLFAFVRVSKGVIIPFFRVCTLFEKS